MKVLRFLKSIHWGYVVSRIGILIVLLILGILAVSFRWTRWFCYPFLREYVKFAAVVILYGFASHFYGLAFPKAWLNYERAPYTPWKIENGGKFYEKKLKIKRWKDVSFDASRAFPDMQSKSTGQDVSAGHLQDMLVETCRAELTHYTIIVFGSVVMGLVMAPYWRIGGIVIYILSNLSSICIVRYNRPRLARLYERALKKEARQKEAAEGKAAERLKSTVETENIKGTERAEVKV